MTTARLTRLETSDQGTFGVLEAAGIRLYTGELPEKDNAPNISRIPAGVYPCTWSYSPRFGRFMYAVNSVPGRAGVRVHSANFMGSASAGYRAQLNGCISLGEKLGKMDGQKALLLSKPAIRRFESHMGHAPFMLEVRGV